MRNLSTLKDSAIKIAVAKSIISFIDSGSRHEGTLLKSAIAQKYIAIAICDFLYSESWAEWSDNSPLTLERLVAKYCQLTDEETQKLIEIVGFEV